MARAPVDGAPNLASGYGQRSLSGRLQEHYGWDLAGSAGDAVRAPEAGTVVAVWVDDATPPWVGYGPGGVELLGASGVWHVLAHVDPSSLMVDVGEMVAEGELLGRMPSHVGAAGPHVHWEVRTGRAVDSPDTRAGNTMVPGAWLAQVRAGAPPRGGSPRGGWGWLLLLLIIAGRR